MKTRITAVILALFFLFSIVATASESGQSTNPNETGNINSDSYYYSIFEYFADIYRNNHLYQFSEEELMRDTLENLLEQNPQLFETVLHAMLTSQDRYSSFHPAGSGWLSIDSLSYGLSIVDKDVDQSRAEGVPKGVYIEKVIKGSSAEEEGILAGDRIVSVAGRNVEGLAMSGVSRLLRYSTVIITNRQEEKDKKTEKIEKEVPPCEIIVARKNDDGTYRNITVMLKKRTLPIEEISHYYDAESASEYIHIQSFLSETLPEDFAALVKELNSKGVKKLTIDLRGNGGGLYLSAVAMANALIPEKDSILYYYRTRNMSEPEAHCSDGTGTAFDSVAVLVDGNTASAAELMAVILRSKGKAKLIGEKTYGKAMGQSQFTNADGDTLSVTTYEILTDTKESYDGKGLNPDIFCPVVEEKYELPALEYFNHTNAAEIIPGAQNEPTLALEKRLSILGCMREEDADGIFDDITARAITLYQEINWIDVTGILDAQTITKITNQINDLKDYYYYTDSQLEVAQLYHTNFSRAKRLATEKINEKAQKDALKAAREKEKQDMVDGIIDKGSSQS